MNTRRLIMLLVAVRARSMILEETANAATYLWSNHMRHSGPLPSVPLYGAPSLTLVPARPGHDMRYAIDASKARRELRWSPQNRSKVVLST